jgi:4-hydroxy-tetrahydrodipicolinate synthase
VTLSGTFPVLPTLFAADGGLATADFCAVVEFVIAAGADGCVYPGVASEVDTLTADERTGMVTLLGETLAGRISFVVGASAATPAEVSAHVAHGARAGASAAMVMAPAALGRDVAAQTAFFAAIEAAVPILLQNAPAPIGAGLLPAEVAAVARAVPAVRMVKEETQPCGQNLSRIREAAGDAILGVFGGAGGRTITDELARGSLGTMPAAELTDLHARLVGAWHAGDTAEARRLFMVSMPLLSFQAVFRMHMTKRVLAGRGIVQNTFVRGAGPRPDAQDLAELDALLDQIADEFRIAPLSRPAEAA